MEKGNTVEDDQKDETELGNNAHELTPMKNGDA